MTGKIRFRSHGKLLLSGEYLVLRGATALAVPLKLGQSFEISQKSAGGPGQLTWHAHTPHKCWFKVVFDLPELNILETDDLPKAAKLQSILLTLTQLKNGIFTYNTHFKVETHLEFEPEWGMGSSSTLIANLARWAGVNPYTLLNFSIGGSGYDIACAIAEEPLLYTLDKIRPKVEKVPFNPVFVNKLYLVYLGKKQDSTTGIQYFNKIAANIDLTSTSKRIGNISREMATTDSFGRFCELSNEHEALVSGLLLTPVLKTQFQDFKGHLKSLGAWGGDFALAMFDGHPTELKEYFAQRGLQTVFSLNEMVLLPKNE